MHSRTGVSASLTLSATGRGGCTLVSGDRYVKSFQQLSAAANDAGLMNRRYGFYWSMMIGWVLALAVLLVCVVVIGDSWYQLIVAALVGVVLAQIGFLAHEATHQEIFATPAWNEWTGRVLSGLFTGMSYSWWLDKHTTHHANPNKEGADPDVDSSVLTFTPEASDRRTGLAARLSKYQGYYFVPLLFFEGFYLHFISIKTAVTTSGRWYDIVFIGIRHAAYLVFLFVVLPPGMAVAFLAVQIAVFGFLLAGAFAPNHIGMPTVPHDVDIDFLRRQVRMSRNIRGGFWVHFFMGGLEYQVEHHLFPMAPRPNLPALQRLAREHLARDDIPYTETSWPEACRTIVAYLNQVGLKNRDPYTCPLVRQYRG
jgi:fatty acid desaturase